MNTLDARPKLLLFVVGAATGLLVTSGDPGIDTLHRLQVTHSLWTREPPVKPEEYPGFGIPGRRGTIHAYYGIGQSLVMLPADVLSTLVLRAVPAGESVRSKTRPVLVCLLTFPMIAGLVLVSVFSLFVKLGYSPNVAALATLALQFGTGHLTYTQIHQENSLLMLMAAGGLAWSAVAAEPPQQTHPLFGMQLAASAILVRLSALLDFASVALFSIFTRMAAATEELRPSRTRAVAIAAVASLAFYLALDRIYQWLRFGDITTTYIHLYGRHARLLNPTLSEQYPFVTPFTEGLLGPFVSPQRSVFLLEPLLTLTALVFASKWRKLGYSSRALGGILVGLLAAQVGFYAKYYDWSGASAWGDRFITVPLHLLGALGVAAALSQWTSLGRGARRAVGVALAVSACVQFASVALWYNLEEAQAIYWHRPVLMPWQRFVNLVAALLGRFEDWGLSYPGFTERSIRPNFLPFLATSYLPMAWAFKALWVIAAAALFAFVVRAARRFWQAEHGRATSARSRG